MPVETLTYEAPCGRLLLGVHEGSLVFCDWLPEARNARTVLRMIGDEARESGDSEVLKEAVRQLDEYFSSARRSFVLPIRQVGSGFRTLVWSGLTGLEYGKRISYAEFTERLGLDRRYVRAVAGAIGANPLSIILPCHRVLGSGKRLTGYAGGLEAKFFLLNLEGCATFSDHVSVIE